jgi:DNA-binding response OmpR family regulator
MTDRYRARPVRGGAHGPGLSPDESRSAILDGRSEVARVRVLVVEDEPRIAAYVRRGLEEHGFAVDGAQTGPEALAWAETVTFDLIVLDILLPEMDGVSVCRELRKRGCGTPILMLTARQGIEDRVEGLDAGADDYLVKPFALRELVARLRALSRRGTDAPRSPVLELADLRMDTISRHVTRGGGVIKLTAKEYAVLECLLRQPERVLTRDQIAEQVWNYDDYNPSNVIDVYIRNLRRKLDDPFALKLIHTVRGAGYRLSRQAEDDAS